MKWYWHAIFFNIYWLLCVSLGNVAFFLLLFYVYFYQSEWRGGGYLVRVIPLIFVACLIDVVFAQLKLIVFAEFPFWLFALWLGFSLSFSSVYAPLLSKSRFLLISLGAMCGPFCYLAGEQLGALTVLQPIVYLFWVPLWAFYFGCFTYLANRRRSRELLMEVKTTCVG